MKKEYCTCKYYYGIRIIKKRIVCSKCCKEIKEYNVKKKSDKKKK